MTTTKLEKIILKQSKAIRTKVLPEVEDTIKTIKPDFESVKKYKTNIIKWLKPVIDLTGYNVYPRNGITEGLDWWYNKEKRGVNMRSGDYQWIVPKDGESKIAYISLPSAKDGNIDIGPKKCPIALDLAYIGSSGKGQKIDLEPDFAFYSLSKSFGVRNIRTGWIFTKDPDPKLEALTHDAKYYNYYAHEVAEKIINTYSIDYIYNRLVSEQFRICNLLNLIPSDSIWLATSNNSKYDKFKRDNINRINLAGVMEYEKT